MAEPIFHVIGTSLTPRRARGGKLFQILKVTGQTDPTVTADNSAGIFGGSYIAKATAASRRSIAYQGGGNWSENAGFTILMRIIPRWTGLPPQRQALFTISGPSGFNEDGIQATLYTTGQFITICRDRVPNNNINFAAGNTGTVNNGFVSGTPVDICFQWDGTTGANAFKVSINGTVVLSGTASAAITSRMNSQMSLIFGFMDYSSNFTANYDINEIAIWNDATSYPVTTSGRTDFVTSTPFDGTQYDSISASELKIGVTKVLAGVSVVGTYYAAERWSLPAVANILSGVTALDNGSVVTGTFQAAPLAKVQEGYAYGPGGTYIGTLHLPVTDAIVAADLKVGITRKVNDVDVTGTYTAAERWSSPGNVNVSIGTTFLVDGVVQTGTRQVVTNVINEAILEGSTGGEILELSEQGDSCLLV